jgi:hypothetical protein
MAKKKRDHYIDNDLFFTEMSAWRKQVDAADAAGTTHPPVTHYIGECFMKIAEHLSRKPNFINYPYRDEMISDGIENCLLYAYNFDPKKSTNPFSYFTQIIYYAFLRRIQKEKKQAYIKLKKIEMSSVDSQMRNWIRDNYLKVGDNFETNATFLTETDINNFDKKEKEKQSPSSSPKKTTSGKKPVNKPKKAKPKVTKAKAKKKAKGKK